MSKIQLVIEISEEDYSRMKEKKMFGNVTVWKNAICNGTPLPKGHGKLKSEEDILSVIMFSKLFDNAKVGEVKKALLNIPTIIEADGGGEE